MITGEGHSGISETGVCGVCGMGMGISDSISVAVAVAVAVLVSVL